MASDAIEVGARADRRARPPRVHTSLVGRDEELAHLTRLLRSSDAQLITITGRSGSGKTRLAIEAAYRLGPDLPGGAVVVALDSVTDMGMLATAVAAALDLAVAPGQDPESAIRRELQFDPSLLLVDDLDELPGAAAWFAQLIGDAPGTRVVATSKSPLRVASERVVRVGPLTSGEERLPQDDELIASPAVQLFADRAAAVQYNFKLDRSNFRPIAELCRRLDGLPLAIELAAARSTTLSPTAQLRLIERGSALDLGRQSGGLRKAIALTYEQLSESDQRVLRSMSVFEGGASLDAARSVAFPDEDEADFVERLGRLVDFNLIEAENASDEPRYRLLPMIREFATEQESAAGDQETSIARQNDFFVMFARATNLLPEHLQILELARERLNLELVLNRLVRAGDTIRAARLVADLGWLWERYGWFPVAQGWLDDIIAAAEDDQSLDPETRALPLIWWVRLTLQHPAAVERAPLIAKRQKTALELARQSGQTDTILLALVSIYYSVLITHDFASAVAATSEGLEIARTTNDERWLARFEVGAGIASSQAGDRETAVRLATSALARSRRNGDLAGILAPVLMLRESRNLGMEVAEPLPTSEEMLVLCRELGDVRGEGWILTSLSARAAASGNTAEALGWMIEGLDLGRRTGLWDAVGFACVHLANLAAANGDDAAVARLYGSISRIMPGIAISLPPPYMAEFQATVDKVRERAGEGTFDRLAHAAALQTWDEVTQAALDYARRMLATLAERGAVPAKAPGPGASTTRNVPLSAGLTPRESEVLRLLATGASNSEIASNLGLSVKTAMNHSMNIYAKLGVRGRAEATAWAFRNGVAVAE